MKPVKIKEDIYWVGAIDWDVRDFHGYTTQRGTTYNAYLVIDEKITLIDTVKGKFAAEMLKRISEIVDPAKIDYVISNHVEMDHSGCLPEIMEIAKNATLFTSPKGESGLKRHYKQDWNFRAIKSGESLNLGKRNINFVLTPMVHWPDNMLSYLVEDKILFSNDAFGQHIASSERFDDELPLHIILEESSKYYANIVLPYGAQVSKALEIAGGLEIDVIAPSHGVIWHSQIPEIIKNYQRWATNLTDNAAVIVYDTMWGSTEKLAYTLQNVFESKGITTKMRNLKTTHISDIMTDILTAKYICVGSSTLNNNMLPTVAGFLTYLKGLAPKNRKAIAFGSFGWGGQSIDQVEQVLKETGFETIEQVKTQFIPDEADLSEMIRKLEGEIV